MNRIILIRHGNTDMLGHVLCGRMAGIHLNAEGQRQAQRLGTYLLRQQHIDAVISSPLERAQETAEALAAPQSLPVTVDERLAEVDFGSWTGMQFAELAHQEEWHHYNRRRSLYHAPGGESFPAVQGRIADFLLQCSQERSGQTLAVVTHADIIRSTLCLCLGISLDFILRLVIDTISVSEIIFNSEGPTVQKINWHLPSEHPL